MIVTISQPRYLPWLGYFHRVAVSDLFIYLDTVQHEPRGWEKRNKVKTDRGWTWLTVPVKARYRALIPEVTIDNDQIWQKKHWRTIETYYKSTPYFKQYHECIRTIYDRTWNKLTDLNLASTKILCECLGLQNKRFARASELNAKGKSTELLVNLCKEVNATVYLSGSQGRNYLKEEEFQKSNIQLAYQDYHHPTYPQLHSEFQPFMSVIDLLFNCGEASLEIILNNQNTI